MSNQVTKKDLGDIRLGNSKDIARIEALLQAQKPKPSEGSSEPSTPATPTVDDKVKKELDELAKYRENERQALLRKLPKKVIEEFKLQEESLARVKEISTLTRTIRKKSVGIDTPQTSEAPTKEKIYQWNPETKRNEWC